MPGVAAQGLLLDQLMQTFHNGDAMRLVVIGCWRT